MPELLPLCLLSPIVELFPNLFMSWWAPANGDVRGYVDSWPRRVAVVALVWGPMIAALYAVAEPSAVALVVGAFVFSAFGIRLWVFDRGLRAELEVGGAKATKGVSSVPELLYFIAFLGIGWILWGAVDGSQWLVPLGIVGIWIGAAGMARFRRGEHENLRMDRLGRTVFVVGFLTNLYHLHRALAVIDS